MEPGVGAAGAHEQARLAAAHVVVDDLGAPALAAGDLHHLLRVLRLRSGEVVSVTDGAGGWRSCRLGPAGSLLTMGAVVRVDPPAPAITVGLALVKGARPDWAVQKLTETGVDRILLLHTDRSVVRWEAGRQEHHLERLRAVARQAAMQSRRLWLPEVGPVITPAGARAALVGAVALATPEGGPPTLVRPAILVGPEGGWSATEEAAEAHGVGLGPGVLRTETAAVAAGVLLAALRAGLVRQPGEGPMGPSGHAA